MNNVTDNLVETAAEIQGMLRTLLLQHSELYQWNDHSGRIVFITGHDYAFRDLREGGHQLQARLLEEYRRFSALMRTLLREQPQDVLKQYSAAESVILHTIEQQPTACTSVQNAFDKADNALANQVELLKHLYAPAMDDVLYVPDTNALIYNADLETWRFDEASRFAIILTPTVLSELDALKVNHRNEMVRQKAEKLINQVKEFRRRGRLTEGVTLVTGRSTILAFAVEPKMENSLPWLDPANNDDRFIATVIETMRVHPRSVVVAVSRDINLQNKAEFSRVPFVEPPEPTTAP